MHVEACGRESFAGPGEVGCEEDCVTDSYDVGGPGLCRVDRDADQVGEGAGVDPFGVDEERVVRDRCGRRLEVEAAAEPGLGHPVAVVGDDRPQLIHRLGVAAGGEADVDALPGDQHVAAVEDSRFTDVGEATVRFECPLDRGPFTTSGQRPRPRDDGDLVEHDSDVLDEDRVREAGFFVEVLDPAPEVFEHPFVEGVLGPCCVDVDRFPFEVGQFTMPDVQTDAPGDSDKHPVDRNRRFGNRPSSRGVVRSPLPVSAPTQSVATTIHDEFQFCGACRNIDGNTTAIRSQ